MKKITELKPDQLHAVHTVFSDIDDTISSEGKITAAAYQALWDLHEAGFKIVVVTGRPAGWCDHIARFWPVDAVIGENGGFYFYYDNGKLHQRYLYDANDRQGFRERLDRLEERILREVPGAGIASDQPYREYDLAIDFCEDVPALPREDVLKIKTLFEQAGAHAKISSIHVNGWYGDFDKLSTAKLFAKERLNVELEDALDQFVFCGDSPNDEPMFKFFPLSFGMANIEPMLNLIKHPPAFVTIEPAGSGFCEVAQQLLKSRNQD